MDDAVRARLESLADEAYGRFQRRLLPGTENILGVRMPLLRRIAREAVRDGAWRTWPAPTPARDSYEETMIYGLALASAPGSDREKRARLESFVPLVDNWAVCDSLCAACRFLETDPTASLEWLEGWLRPGAEFEIRFALVCMLDHFAGQKAYAERLLLCGTRACGDGYYARMAAGWLIAEIAVSDVGRVRSFLCETELSDDSIRHMAVRKIVESRRISQSEKALILSECKSMKGRKNT